MAGQNVRPKLRFCRTLANFGRPLSVDRLLFAALGLALLSQNYWCRLTSTLYKLDTSVRQTVGVGSEGVRLRESSLYNFTAHNVYTVVPRFIKPLIFQNSANSKEKFFPSLSQTLHIYPQFLELPEFSISRGGSENQDSL